MRFGARSERHCSYISISSSIVPSTRIAASSARLLTRATPVSIEGASISSPKCRCIRDRGLLCSAR
jgi:hypothetical protein